MCPIWRLIVSILAQEFQAFWLSGACVWGVWPGYMVDCLWWPLDWPSGACGRHWREASWWSLEWRLHRSTLRKNIWISGGTWESNPGPNTCMPTHKPTEPLSFFDIIMDNDHYEREISASGIWWKRAPVFKLTNHVRTRHLRLPLFSANISK